MGQQPPMTAVGQQSTERRPPTTPVEQRPMGQQPMGQQPTGQRPPTTAVGRRHGLG